MTITQTRIISLNKAILASGLPEGPCIEPLVSVYPNPEFEKTYNLQMHLYVPDTAEPKLDPNLDTILKTSTQAGELSLRIVDIDYDQPATPTGTYSLWCMNVIYQVIDEEADAVSVRFIVGDPLTSRGTVTTVSKN